ncbi:beta-galactosidase-like protein [Lentzea atacamensis]|uniref:Beta-galactosidase-like protein n=1 Tax=Lentzea atacamensis TaxID=531938 RepID=A0A316HW31_9PSEU|nr:Beta-galactosidase C-terminal domain [Lentzea atacamensis]PWK84896.1 beta-galactosidase-like protein [Lentzea atacamensis]
MVSPPAARWLRWPNRTDEPVEVSEVTGDVIVGPADGRQLVLPPRAVAVLCRHAG